MNRKKLVKTELIGPKFNIGQIVKIKKGKTKSSMYKILSTTINYSSPGDIYYSMTHMLGGKVGAHEEQLRLATKKELAVWATYHPQLSSAKQKEILVALKKLTDVMNMAAAQLVKLNRKLESK